MKQWLSNPAVQIVLILCVFALVGYKFGVFGIVITAPGFAAALARPVINLVGNIRHGMRENVWLPVHGHHFVFKDVTIHVLEDESHFRWVPLAEARRVGGVSASEALLEATYRKRFQRMGKTNQAYLRDDALVEYLSKSSDAVALRFRTWVDRTVAMPGQRIRDKLGVRSEHDAKDDD